MIHMVFIKTNLSPKKKYIYRFDNACYWHAKKNKLKELSNLDLPKKNIPLLMT